MSPPRVSIVLPVYNGAQYLDEAVRSIRRQTRRDWELIVVDDASTDATPGLIDAWTARDARVRVIRHDRNRRLPAALNTGLEAAGGEYLTWTSYDNRYLPRALAEMVAFLDGRADVALVYAAQDLIDETGRTVGCKSAPPADHLGLGNCIGGCFLFRRGVPDVIGGYREDLFLVEDYDFWLRLRARFAIHPLARTLYEYRLHGQSLTSTRRQRVLELTERIVAEHLPNMRGAGRLMQANLCLQLAHLARARKDPQSARRHFWSAMRRLPWRAMRHLPGMVSGGLLGRGVQEVVEPAYLGLRRRRHPRLKSLTAPGDNPT